MAVLPSAAVNGGPRLCILMPVFNDWDAAAILCGHLDRALAGRGGPIQIIAVNDGSTTAPPQGWPGTALTAIGAAGILHLARNVGHQRAIALGLAYIQANIPVDAVAIMDADGEDRPEDLLRLLDAMRDGGGDRVVFAQRRRRVEGMVFRAGYLLYRTLHRVGTGVAVQVGNFSIVPARHLTSLVVSAELWAHYAAAVYALRLPVQLVPADRGRRLSGRSHMNYVMLVTHGLGALSVFRNRVGARVMIAVAAVCAGLLAALAAAILKGAVSSMAIACLLALVIVQIGITGFGFAFAMFAERQELGCVPSRDYVYFVREFQRLHESRAIPVSRG